MSEYTPTTDEMRFAWAERVNKHDQEGAEEFDRWLAEVERAAAEKALLAVALMWEETAEQFGTDPEDLKIAEWSADCLRNLATQYRRAEEQ